MSAPLAIRCCLALALMLSSAMSAHAACGGGGGGGGSGGGSVGGISPIGRCGGASAPAPVGRAYKVAISVPGAEDGAQQEGRIVFTDKTFTFPLLANGRVEYTRCVDSTTRTVTVKATTGDAKTGTIVFDASITGDILAGTLTSTDTSGKTRTLLITSINPKKGKG